MTINNISNKLKTNGALIVPVDKSNYSWLLLFAYGIDIYNKTLEFINNNNIKVLSYDATEIKKILKRTFLYGQLIYCNNYLILC